MGNFNERLPKWESAGSEPPASKQTEGWQPQERPPAGWLNWLFNRSYKAIEELQEKAITMDEGDFAARQELEEHKADEAAHGIGSKIQDSISNLNSHKAETANPHTVTKSQVGLGSVDNLKQMPMVAPSPFTDDPNTTLKGYIVTNHVNTPNAAYYWHIKTSFYNAVGDNSGRTQIAQMHNGSQVPQMYIRHKLDGAGGAWQPWTKLVNASGDTFTGTVAHGRSEVQQPRLKDYTEVVTSALSVSGTYAINLANGNVFRLVLSGNITFSITNVAATGQAHSFTLVIQQPGTAAALTWPSSVSWAGGQIPAPPTASRVAVYTFVTFDNGFRWYGAQAMTEMVI